MINRGNSTAPLEPDSWWANAILDVPPDASQEAINAALMQTIEAGDFSPDPDVILAFDQVRGRVFLNTHRSGPLKLAIQNQLKPLVEQFTKAYFQLDPAERLEAWNQLWNRSARFPMLRRRLAWLQKGLAVELPQIDSDERMMTNLITLIRECYVATPWRAVRVRQHSAKSIQEALLEWKAALAELGQLHPEFVQLDEELVEWVKRGASYFPPAKDLQNRWNARIPTAPESAEHKPSVKPVFDDREPIISIDADPSRTVREYAPLNSNAETRWSSRERAEADREEPRPSFFTSIESYGTSGIILFVLAALILQALLSLIQIMIASTGNKEHVQFPAYPPGMHDPLQTIDDPMKQQLLEKLFEERRFYVPANALRPENVSQPDTVIIPNPDGDGEDRQRPGEHE